MSKNISSDIPKLENKYLKQFFTYSTALEDFRLKRIITYEKIKEDKINYNKYPFRIIPIGISIFILNFFNYPLHTEFLRRRLASLNKEVKRPKLKFEKLRLFGKGGLYIGFPLFFWSRFLPFLIVENLRFQENFYFFTFILLQIITYPILMNSNLRALKTKENIKLSNLKNIFELYKNKNNYKGSLYYVFNYVLFFFPILNYFCHYIESARIAYSLGPCFGYNFKTIKETRKYLKVNKCLSWGRFFFNFPTHVFNFFVISSIALNRERKN